MDRTGACCGQADEVNAAAKVDAIIVPTVRPLGSLEEAASAARSLGCPLVTLHSPGKTSASEADDVLSVGRWT